MDARESEHVADFRDGPVVLLNQQLGVVQLQVGNVLLRTDMQIGPEQILQRRAGHGELRTEIFNSKRRADVVVNIDQNLVEQRVLVMLLHRVDAGIRFFFMVELVQKDNDFLEIQDRKFLIEVVIGLYSFHKGAENLVDVFTGMEDAVAQ